MSTTNAKPVWLITGCSTGFGREIVKNILMRGYRAVITARRPDSVADLTALGDTLVLPLDVTKQNEVDAAVFATKEKYGRLDVLVNNAGLGYFAAFEESEEDEVRWMFEVNVFGLGRMTQAVLPLMRTQRSGAIVNISSLAGLRGAPALSYYNASKFAVEGLSEALWQEVEPLGIRVMVVEPSGFRTDWAGRSANESIITIADYAATAGARRQILRSNSGKQPGDPVRAAEAIVNAIASGNPAHHLPLGNMAYDLAQTKFSEISKEFATVESIARGADSPL